MSEAKVRPHEARRGGEDARSGTEPSPSSWLRAPVLDGARCGRARWAQKLVEGSAPLRASRTDAP